MEIVIWVLSVLCAMVAVTFIVAVAATTVQVREKPVAAPAEFPPVSLVKPMKGADEALAANLESFFTLRYPAPFEIVFACADANDPATAVARAVAARFPHVPVKFVACNPNLGLNPKVSNLAAALAEVQHDLIFQTDANVRVAPDHLKHIVSEFIGRGAGLLSSLIVGTGERAVGAALDNLHLTTVIAPSVAFASRVGRQAVVVGKALMYRNSELRALGGIEQFKDVLAEDYLMGECYVRAGKRVLLSSATIANVNERTSVRAYLSRHARWLKMNAVINPAAFTLRFLVSPVWALPLLVLALLGSWACEYDCMDFVRNVVAMCIAVGTIIIFLVAEQVLFRALRHQWMAPRLMLLSAVDALLMWAVWPYSAVSRSIEWRGEQLRLGGRTKLAPRS